MRVFVPSTDKDKVKALFGQYEVLDRLMAYWAYKNGANGYIVVRKDERGPAGWHSNDFEF